MMFQNREPKPKSSRGIGNLNLLVSVIFDIYPISQWLNSLIWFRFETKTESKNGNEA